MAWWVQCLQTVEQRRVPAGQAWRICRNCPCGLNAVTVTLSIVWSYCLYTSSYVLNTAEKIICRLFNVV